ncbi:uncharacterized protein LOC121888225 isoform X1 [Scomber scombrus]|uniref:Uncharacterized protein LOC121888225 isoform X1 n=1 Tax=Scomber scombrus TaxID=13677 RepID=A0AAV1P9N5_SCOSC
MEGDEELPTYLPQCPAGSEVGRRNVEVKNEESNNDRVQWTVGMRTSKPKMSIELSSSVCKDKEPCMDCCNTNTDAELKAQGQDVAHLPLLTLKGSLNLASTDPTGKASVHTSITGNDSTSSAQQENVIKDPRLNLKPCNNPEVNINLV